MAERATGPFAAYLDELRARLGDLTPGREGRAPLDGEAIVAPGDAILARLPEALDKALAFEAVQRRVERAFLQRQHARTAGARLLHHRIAIHRPLFEEGQEHQVETPLEEFALLRCHRSPFPFGPCTTQYCVFLSIYHSEVIEDVKGGGFIPRKVRSGGRKRGTDSSLRSE
jgi:hypothetical protein